MRPWGPTAKGSERAFQFWSSGMCLERWGLGVGFEGAPVAAVVGGDVGAVGAYCDPGFGGGVVGYGGAVAMGWGLGGCPRVASISCYSGGFGGRIWFFEIAADRNSN